MLIDAKIEFQDVRHLGIVASSYRTTHEVFLLGHINLSNFMVIGCIVLKIWGFEFLQNWLEMPIRGPKKCVLGECEPQNVICQWSSIIETLKRRLKPRVLSIKSFNSVHSCDM